MTTTTSFKPETQSSADVLIEKTLARIESLRRFPESTYRLQFHAGFTFRDAAAISGYLADLGITHAYASPYLKARPGSTHGYDVIDHSTLNPELGTIDDFQHWRDTLKADGLETILDTVPNHVGVGTNENAWWNDVLENGPSSRYAGYFDIAWRGSLRPELHDKVLLPLLGEPYGAVLERGQLRLAFEHGAFSVNYYDRAFPLSPRTYDRVLRAAGESLERNRSANERAIAELAGIINSIHELPDRVGDDRAAIEKRDAEVQESKRRLQKIVETNAAVHEAIDASIARFNGTPGDPHSFDLLDDLLESQCYRLAYWRVAPDEINYRRFFDINDLAALSMEREEVFEATHDLILNQLARGELSGLRIDHPDGLFDPKQYFQRLQQHYILRCAQPIIESDPRYQQIDPAGLRNAVAEYVQVGNRGPGERQFPLYVVAEKILAAEESLPDDWAVEGTSGYEFLNVVNGLFVDPNGQPAFTRRYHEWINDATPFADIAYQKKLLILRISLASELQMLAHQLDHLAQKDRHSRDFTLTGLRDALREVIACFPVYRSYISDEGVHETDRHYIDSAIRAAIERNPGVDPTVFHYIRDTLLLKLPEFAADEDRAEQVRFAGKFQQVTAPVTAKGIEDTAFYVYNRLISLNEVGGEPDRFGIAPNAVHSFMLQRQQKWPYALSPLSTHDTKRSEDVRARINVLSEIPELWWEAVSRWGRLNEPLRQSVDGRPAPDANEEYLIYQTLVGAWPLEPHSRDEDAAFVKRVQQFVVKALHEAKVHSSWTNPNAAYDAAAQAFVGRILDEGEAGPFLRDFRAFQRRISHYGLLNSLSQTLLQITAPGVPDIYQGTGVWDLSLVDPDNRRPVDYIARKRMLTELGAAHQTRKPAEFLAELLRTKEDGRIKLFVTSVALRIRRENPGLFSTGDYLPLSVEGVGREHIFAFARRQGDRWAVVAVPRLLTRLVPNVGDLPLGPRVWGDTRIILPQALSEVTLKNVFSEKAVAINLTGTRLDLRAGEAFADFPVFLAIAR